MAEGATTADQVLATCSGDDVFLLDGYFESIHDGCFAPSATVSEPATFTLNGDIADGLYITPWDADGALSAVRLNRRR